MARLGQIDRQIIQLQGESNMRGITTSQLIYDFQHATDMAKDPGYHVPLDFEDNEWWTEWAVFTGNATRNGILKEIDRRRRLTYDLKINPNVEVIQAIKDAVRIEDVLEWYTEVFLDKHKWSYRCTLHGADEHPSGVIYPEEKRCWCFACNTGGDVFDVVQSFERVDLKQAISKLARHVGLDTKPMSRTQKVKGGFVV